jgi:hypothetical protein
MEPANEHVAGNECLVPATIQSFALLSDILIHGRLSIAVEQHWE